MKKIKAQSLKIACSIALLIWSNYLLADTSPLETPVIDWVTQFTKFLSIPLIIVILLNKQLRLHFLWNRIIGKPVETKDKKIRKTLENQASLENFRSAYPGIHVDNIYEVHAIIDFCKNEKIDISELSAVPVHIKHDDEKNLEVTLPKKYGLSDKIGYGVLIFFTLALFMIGASAPPLSGLFGVYILKMKETQDYIWLSDRKYAKKLYIDPKKIKKLTVENCGEDAAIYNMTKNEFSIMCDALKGNKEDDETLLDIKEKSIWLSSFLCSISAIFIYLNSIQFIKINKTIKLLKKINSKKSLSVLQDGS